jgi:repressor LexA
MTTANEPLPLTERQREVLEFIKGNMAFFSPTVREIAAAMSIKSPHGVTVHLEALQRKGYIRMASGKPRGIEVLHGN